VLLSKRQRRSPLLWRRSAPASWMTYDSLHFEYLRPSFCCFPADTRFNSIPYFFEARLDPQYIHTLLQAIAQFSKAIKLNPTSPVRPILLWLLCNSGLTFAGRCRFSSLSAPLPTCRLRNPTPPSRTATQPSASTQVSLRSLCSLVIVAQCYRLVYCSGIILCVSCGLPLIDFADSAKALKARGKAHRLLGNYEQASKDLSAGQKIDFDEDSFQVFSLARSLPPRVLSLRSLSTVEFRAFPLLPDAFLIGPEVRRCSRSQASCQAAQEGECREGP
jgi:tetratricopeptide (TPR) repeat protein